MKPETKTPLTPLDLCTLLAHEAVALLNADALAVDSAIQLQKGLRIIAAANELENAASPLLAWIDWEVKNANRFIDCGEDRATPHKDNSRTTVQSTTKGRQSFDCCPFVRIRQIIAQQETWTKQARDLCGKAQSKEKKSFQLSASFSH